MGLTSKDVRDIVHTSPFRAFRLLLADGKSVCMAHPDFIVVGRDLVVCRDGDARRRAGRHEPGPLRAHPASGVLAAERCESSLTASTYLLDLKLCLRLLVHRAPMLTHGERASNPGTWRASGP